MLSLAVAFVCLVPMGDTHPPRIPYFDKVVHVFLFGTMAFVWMKDLLKQEKYKQHAQKTAATFCIFYGYLIEIFQDNMHLGRTFEFLDVYADALGAFLGTGILAWLNKRKGR